MTRQPKNPAHLVIGEVLRPHGTRGEARMRVMTDNREHLLTLEYVYLADSPADKSKSRLELAGLRFNKAYALLKFAGIDSRDEAEALRSKLVLIDIDQAPPLEDGQYYLFQLVGMKVAVEGVDLGFIKEVLQTGANDVYIVNSDVHGELLIPAHDETILSIDFAAGVVAMTLPAGLIPD